MQPIGETGGTALSGHVDPVGVFGWLGALRRRDEAVLQGTAHRLLVGLLAATVLVSVATFVATANPGLAAAPAVLLALAYAVWRLPLRATMLPFTFAVVGAFAPSPEEGSEILWMFVRPVHRFLFTNLNRLTGINALVITGTEVVILLLVALVVLRAVRGIRLDDEGRVAGVNAMTAFCVLSFLAVLWLFVWGVGRGGDARGSFFQFRELLFLPLLALLFSYSIRGVADFVTVAVVITAGACLKIALGLFYFVYDIWPHDVKHEFMTGHHDTVLYAVVLFMWGAAWVHRPRSRTILPTLLVCGWLITGIILNNRRIAYVSIVAEFFVLYLLLRGPVKRWMTRTVLMLLPVIAVYLLASRNHSSGIFKPGNQLMSVTQQKDASSIWRDIENFNLLATLKAGPVLGSGWGHEYIEVVKADDISRFMPQYRMVPHNSILWLLGVGGAAGFILLWMPVPVAVFLAARSYRFARTPLERTAAVTVLGTLIAFANQAWGDMGTQGPVTMTLVGCSFAIAAKLARSTGAWPSTVRIFAQQRPSYAPSRSGLVAVATPAPMVQPE